MNYYKMPAIKISASHIIVIVHIRKKKIADLFN